MAIDKGAVPDVTYFTPFRSSGRSVVANMWIIVGVSCNASMSKRASNARTAATVNRGTITVGRPIHIRNPMRLKPVM